MGLLVPRRPTGRRRRRSGCFPLCSRDARSCAAHDRGDAAGKPTGRSIVNIRELDEESRRTGVWPPRRIILRVEREGADGEASSDGQPAPVKVGDVDLSAPPPAPAAVAPPTAPSLSPSVSPTRRPVSPAARGVTPAAPALPPEDAEFEKWLEEPLAPDERDPEYQAPPVWLPEDRRLRAERRHRRVARKSRSQLFGASAATTLAVGGCAAAIALVGLSQTETVGGSLGLPSIGLFGTPPEPSSTETADSVAPKPAAPKSDRKPAGRRSERSARSARRARTRARRSARSASARTSAPTRRRRAAAPSAARRTAAPSSSRAPARRAVVNRPAPAAPRRAASPPPPPPPVTRAPARPTTPSRPQPSAPVAPSRPAGSVPSRPAPSAPDTGSSPALDSNPGL